MLRTLFHFFIHRQPAHCFWLPVTGWKDLRVFATSSTLSLFHSFSLVHFTFLPSSTYCSAYEWLGYLFQPPVPLPAGCRNKQGGGGATVIWWVVGVVALPAAPDAQTCRVHSAAPSLPQSARSCRWKAGISYSSVGVSSRAACTKSFCSFSTPESSSALFF